VPKMWKIDIIDFLEVESKFLPKSLKKTKVDEINSDFLTELHDNIISKIVTPNTFANLDKEKRNKISTFLDNLRKKFSDDKPLNESEIKKLRKSCSRLMEEVIPKINQGIRGSNDKDIVGKIVTYIKNAPINPTRRVNEEKLKNKFFDTFRDLLNSGKGDLSFGKSRRRRSVRRRKSKTKSTRRRRRSVRRKKSKHSMKKFSSFKLTNNKLKQFRN
jgi:hypothetical protein